MEPQNVLTPERVRWDAQRVSRVLCGMVDRNGKLPLGHRARFLDLSQFGLKRSCVPAGELSAVEKLDQTPPRRREYIPLLVSNLVTGYYDTLSLYLKESPRLHDLREMSVKYTLYALNDRLEDYIKFQTAYLQARAFRDCLPPPDPPSWLEEPLGRFLSKRLNRKVWMRCALRARPADVSLALSLYQCKRAAPPLPEDKVDANLVKSTERLSKLPTDGYWIDQLEEECKRTVDELCQNAKAEGWNRKISNDAFPSQSASLNMPISRGGQMTDLVPESNTIVLPTLIGMLQSGPTTVTPVYGWDAEWSDILSDKVLGAEIPCCLDVRRSPVLEPFKVRVITMGPAVPYFRARRIQGVLWSLLKSTRATHLPNRPLEASDLDFYVRRRGAELFRGEDVPYVSGDYSAATDNLNPSLSAAVVDRLCDHVLSNDGSRLDGVHPWRALFHRVLLGHRILDGPRGKEVEVCKQTWGQLMGSPLSFPVLCIVNLAVTRFALEKIASRRISLNESGILINGDDILFRCPERGIPFWQELVTAAGLEPSPGKNYVSFRYAQLNSEVYDMDKRGGDYVPFLKVNLLYGTLARGCERRSAADLCYGSDLEAGGTFGHRAKALIKGFPLDVQDRLMTRFIRSIKDFLGKVPDVSWFAHPRYGGLGLPVTRSISISPYHLRIAAYLSCGGAEHEEARCMMHWLHNPSKWFNSATMLKTVEVARKLNLPVLKVPKALASELPEFPLKKAVMLSALRLGVEYPATETGDRERLRDWHRFFRGVGRKAARTRRIGGCAEDRRGLFLMGVEKCISGPAFETGFDWGHHSAGPNIWERVTNRFDPTCGDDRQFARANAGTSG